MLLFTPIFDRKGMQVAWLLDDGFVLAFNGNLIGSVQPDGGVVSVDHSKHFGGFAEGKFKDTDGFVVAFIDRTLEQNSVPSHHEHLSPVLAEGITNWSPLTWRQYSDDL